MAFGNQVADGANIPASNAYLPGTGFKVVRGGRLNTDASSNDSVAVAFVPEDGAKATYTYTTNAAVPYATATDWIVIRGSAAKVARIVRVEITGAITTAATIILTLKKHTTANTAGTSTSPTPIQHDTGDAAASSTVLLYSAAPTINASATIIETVRMFLQAAAATAVPDRYVKEFGNGPYEAHVLRGVAQEFAINLGGGAVPAGEVFDIAITWTEE